MCKSGASVEVLQYRSGIRQVISFGFLRLNFPFLHFVAACFFAAAFFLGASETHVDIFLMLGVMTGFSA
jgi:hypothetical protein